LTPDGSAGHIPAGSNEEGSPGLADQAACLFRAAVLVGTMNFN
jgi:hypothetical protein